LLIPNSRYLILEFLGQGTFGQVVKCLNIKTNDLVAIKIIKNQKSYYNQGKSEVRILKKLNEKDPETNRKIVKLLDCFYYRFHLCLVFELLDVSLLDLLYSTDFKGIALSDIAFYTKQLLQGLIKAHEEKIVHCDIKPENILFIAFSIYFSRF
jgi:dual specificity protein kinase YAK1